MRLRVSTIHLLGVTTVLSALLAAPPVLAQGAGKKKPATEQSQADIEARRVFKEGDRLYAEGDYEGAVRAFEKAFELSKQPALKYNLANAYERLARYEEALAALKDYEPHAAADERDVLKRRIGKLQERADQQKADREKAAATGEAPPEQAESAPASEARPADTSVSTAEPTPILGYVLVGVGAVGVGVGAFFGVQALGSKSDAEKACPEAGGARRCPSSASDTLSTNSRDALIADISIGVGLVAAAVGTYFIIKSPSSKDSASAQVRATAGPRGGNLSLVGTF
jgi:tetratricopeptide (TPR) repeat protein